MFYKYLDFNTISAPDCKFNILQGHFQFKFITKKADEIATKFLYTRLTIKWSKVGFSQEFPNKMLPMEVLISTIIRYNNRLYFLKLGTNCPSCQKYNIVV